MSELLAIDAGSTESGYVVLDTESRLPLTFGVVGNEIMRYLLLGQRIEATQPSILVVEYVAPRGMPVSKETMRMIWWLGRFREAWDRGGPQREYGEVLRRDVKMELCGHGTAKDANIRRAIMDLYPATGGGVEPVVGIKSAPGPLYGVSKDVWAALGVALTWLERSEVAHAVE